MIILASKQEKEILTQLRNLQPLHETVGLSAEVVSLNRQIAELNIQKGQIEEGHARQERELRHMIGLEKNRQKVELEQAKKEAQLTLREAKDPDSTPCCRPPVVGVAGCGFAWPTPAPPHGHSQQLLLQIHIDVGQPVEHQP